MSQLKSCGFIVFRKSESATSGKEFLLLKHPKRWDLPKGHVDPGETDRQCALRELIEETGIDECDIEIDETFEFRTEYTVKYKRTQFRPQNKTLIIYLAELTRDIPLQLTEHDSYQWFAWDPPHQIQIETLDDLLAEIFLHWNKDQK